MNIRIYFKQGAPNQFVNRYSQGPKAIKDMVVEENFIIIQALDEDRVDVIRINEVLGYEVTQ